MKKQSQNKSRYDDLGSMTKKSHQEFLRVKRKIMEKVVESLEKTVKNDDLGSMTKTQKSSEFFIHEMETFLGEFP